MIAAAQAAAEAALREALAKENESNNQQQQQPPLPNHGSANVASAPTAVSLNSHHYYPPQHLPHDNHHHLYHPGAQPQALQQYSDDIMIQQQQQYQGSYHHHPQQHFQHQQEQEFMNNMFMSSSHHHEQQQLQHLHNHQLPEQSYGVSEDDDCVAIEGGDNHHMMDFLYQQQQQQEDDGSGIIMDANHLMLNHQQHQQQQHQHQQQQQLSTRPKEHYMTITNDGTIVEASDSVIGYPPEALLMTSIYETLFDEDIPGFLCIKSQFWDKQILDVEVVIRRRSVNGELIWLCCKALQWVEMNSPAAKPQYHQAIIPGGGVLVLAERVVDDVAAAQWLNRRIRITAVIVQAAEAALLTHCHSAAAAAAASASSNTTTTTPDAAANDDSNNNNNNNNNNNQTNNNSDDNSETRLSRNESGTLLNETMEMEVLLRKLQETRGTRGGDFSHDNLHQLLEIAATHRRGGSSSGKSGSSGGGLLAGHDGGGNSCNGDQQQQQQQRRKNFDPYAIIESVRKGIRLDLGLTTSLQAEEVRLLTMVLTGELPVDQVAPLVWQSLQQSNTMTLSDLLLWHRQQRQQQQQEQQQPQQAIGMPSQQQQDQHNHRWDPATSAHQNMASRRGMAKSPPPPSLQRSNSPGNPRVPIATAPANPPPPISVVNLSYTYIGNAGVEILGEALCTQGTVLKTVDISFCGIDEKGFLALAKALAKRKKRTTIGPIKGLILSGNYVTQTAAAALGTALAISTVVKRRESQRRHHTKRNNRSSGGYDSDSSDDEDDEDFDYFSSPSESKEKRRKKQSSSSGTSPNKQQQLCCNQHSGIQVLHMASTSLKAGALGRLLEGLGPHSSMRELNLSSNHFGPPGAGVLSRCLEGNSSSNSSRSNNNALGTHVPLPYLDRIDISNNSLGDEGATQLTKIISNRSKVDLVDLRLSSNSITSAGIEKIMNKLLHHNLVSLALDKNAIGDQGCQLVAASLQSMKSLARLNLSFNQIGSRGINSLMRSLIACESITFLGLSGNILKISGAMALAFTLAQHPRLEELHLDNCCLGQAAQCHITAGIISNRWVPMKRLAGYAVGPPMVAIGALKPYAQNLSNEECFRIRKDEQMKTILRWMENHRGSRAGTMDPGVILALGRDSSDQRFLTPEFVSNINDVHGIPSQNAYFRMLGWLSSIPFDDDELTVLQKYFYDVDGGDGDRGSDGYVNLKLRGDLLAALDSEIAEEIRDVMPPLGEALQGSVGIDLDKLHLNMSSSHSWTRELSDLALKESFSNNDSTKSTNEALKQPAQENALRVEDPESSGAEMPDATPQSETEAPQPGAKEKKTARAKPRISMFPKFEQQLEQLKSAAAEMIELEEDPMHHEVILTQYAEASLTILRQLRYHCMNSGLDGWRQGGLKRKVLVIDDSKIIRRMVSRAFEDANFIVDTAANGAEGVEKMKASIYDIAFMDIDMPVMNGFEATKKLREWEDKSRPGARQPICALTAAYVDDFERSELMKFKEAGLDVMESKPCNIPRLLKVVDDVSPMFSNLRLDATLQERSNVRTVH
ncbi:hypothetical protein ACA910_019163 [Epithemia clementina (nom. ined.)]